MRTSDNPRRSTRRSHASAVVLCALALLLPALSRAQEAPAASVPTPPPSAQTYRVAGRVVDAKDGHAIRHAGVTLLGNGVFGGHPPEAQADDAGAFAFAGIPAGKFRVQASARGYIAAAYDEHQNFSSAVVTGAGLPTESLVFRLEPAAMLHGRVTDEVGDPVRNAGLTVFHENLETGVRRITQFRNARTNDLGEYEITGLPPGTYYASVQGVPWYAIHPPSQEASGSQNGVALDINPVLDVVYPLTFYPEATDSQGASPIRLEGGDRFHADFRLTPQPAMRLAFRLPEGAAGAPGEANGFMNRMPVLQQKVFDSYQFVPQQQVQMFGSTLQVAGLSAGNYIVRTGGPNGLSGPQRSVHLTGGSVTLDIAGPPSLGAVTLTVSSPGSDSGTPSDTAGSPLPPKLPPAFALVLHRINAESEEDGGSAAPVAPVKDGKAEFAHVEPGDYRIETRNGRFHVESITAEGNTRPDAWLHVTGGGQSAAIALGAGTGTLPVTGYARRDGKGVSGAMVVLVPAAGDHSIDLYRRDQSDLDGSFRFAGVLPGNYLLVAIADAWSLEWGKPEALAPYLLQAVPVVVPADSRTGVRIAEAVAVQPRKK